MKEIDAAKITEEVARLCMEANYELEEDVLKAIEEGFEKEESPAGKEILGQLLENAEMRPVIDAWYPAGLAVPRGLDVRTLAARMGVATETPSESVEQAMASARKAATATDRIVVFGSFYTVAEALRLGV